jgi:hypothetical protein
MADAHELARQLRALGTVLFGRERDPATDAQKAVLGAHFEENIGFVPCDATPEYARLCKELKVRRVGNCRCARSKRRPHSSSAETK